MTSPSSSPASPEPAALRGVCQTVVELLDTSGPWLPHDHPALNELATALKAYYLLTKRMYRLTRSRDNCIKIVAQCASINTEVRASILATLQSADVLSNNRLETVLPLMDAVTTAAQAVSQLTPDSPLRGRVGAMRNLEDACLKLEEAVQEGSVSGSSDSLAPASDVDKHSADSPKDSANGTTDKPRLKSHGKPGGSPAAAKPADSLPDTAHTPSDGPGFRENKLIASQAGGASAPAGLAGDGVAPASVAAALANAAGSADTRPIPRLSVAQLREFLGQGGLPEGTMALAGWPERNPDDLMPNSWIQPNSCPTCNRDVLVAFGKSRKETIFCQSGHVLKFNQTQNLIQS